MDLVNLARLTQEASSHKLELGLAAGFGILAEIESALGKADEVEEIAKLAAAINEVKSHANPKGTIIGVVGGTGAGKSSVINAVLDEECLVPTNCMRACTAVITELRWNSSENYSSRYRAEIEFISREDWCKELQVLFCDFAGGSEDLSTSDSDAGIAYSKINAVYPALTKRNLLSGEVTVESLALNESVSGILGTVMEFAASNSKKLLALVGAYIDSHEKTTSRSQAMEYWPLVKVVRIYVKSPILETGMILVDLPGVQDSNAARSAVASRYIQDCTGLWVVAPITRAVDDKTAKNLLGDSFRRQLQLDGTYSAITFICSKADDISLTEVTKGLTDDHPAIVKQRDLDELERSVRLIPDQMDLLINRHSELAAGIEDADRQITSISSALRRAENHDEEDVFLVSPSKKRSSRLAALTPRKKTRLNQNGNNIFSDDDDYPDIDIFSDSEDELMAADPEPKTEKLSKRDAFDRLDALNTAKEKAYVEKAEIERQQKALKKELKAKRAEVRKLRSEVKSACIRYRNEYSRPSIQYQFADGLKEMDQDLSAELDEEDIDPSVEGRDYAQVAADLPVFCVSSKAYQKMSGRLDKDEFVSGFLGIESTEIPALQRHAQNTISFARAAACRRFYAELRQYLMSIMMQVVISNQPQKLADELRDHEAEFLKKALKTLKYRLEGIVMDCMDTCGKKMKSRVFAKLETAANSAADQAVDMVAAWGRRRDEGGLAFQTYRATCVRDGTFRKANMPMDFNEDLVKPMKARISKKWENMFDKYIPEQLAAMGIEAATCVVDFATQLSQREALSSSPTFKLVLQRVNGFGENLRDVTPLYLMVKDFSRAANRIITPTITKFMKDAYEACAGETGLGSFKRMKLIMEQHTCNERGVMFARAAAEVQGTLTKMIEAMDEKARQHITESLANIEYDCMSLIASQTVFRALEDVRGEIEQILLTADASFDHVYRQADDVEMMDEDAAVYEVDHHDDSMEVQASP